jgi:hypothetical protein
MLLAVQVTILLENQTLPKQEASEMVSAGLLTDVSSESCFAMGFGFWGRKRRSMHVRCSLVRCFDHKQTWLVGQDMESILELWTQNIGSTNLAELFGGDAVLYAPPGAMPDAGRRYTEEDFR